MAKYIVGVREVWVQLVEIEADDVQQAVDRVKYGEGDYLDDGIEYSHTLDSDNFTAEKVD